MSLLHLVHQNVVLKFSASAESPFDPETAYVFRLTGVDGMGFLQVQELSVTGTAAPEPASAAYWINKDNVREIHEFELIKDKSKLVYSGKAAPTVPAPIPQPATPVDTLPTEPASREPAPKLPKSKIPAKKSVLKQKPIFN